MGKFLIIINISLTIAAVFLTRNLVNPTIPADSNSVASLPAAVNSQMSNLADESHDQISKLSRQESDILWEKNLFHPDRSFEESIIDDLDIKEPEQVNEHFELMSIAQVANKSCASIRVIKGANKRRKQRRNTRTNNRRKNAGRRGAKASAKDKNQKVYMLGDSVGETGFKLNEISIDYVMIKKGDQELTLRLDKSDESSEKRRQVAKKEVDNKSKKDLAARKKIEQAKTKDKKPPKKIENKDTAKKSIPPPPPPPPPPAFNRGVQQPVSNQSRTNTTVNSQERRKSQYPRPTRR